MAAKSHEGVCTRFDVSPPSLHTQWFTDRRGRKARFLLVLSGAKFESRPVLSEAYEGIRDLLDFAMPQIIEGRPPSPLGRGATRQVRPEPGQRSKFSDHKEKRE